MARKTTTARQPRVKAPQPITDQTVPSTDDVASRAFALFCARGGQHGHDLEDWLQAERELARQQTMA
jgi:hypothetical protein